MFEESHSGEGRAGMVMLCGVERMDIVRFVEEASREVSIKVISDMSRMVMNLFEWRNQPLTLQHRISNIADRSGERNRPG